MRNEFVQVCNPITRKFVLINRTLGAIVKHKKTPGPYKGVAIKGVRYDFKETANEK